MKPRVLLLAAFAGLICGLLVKSPIASNAELSHGERSLRAFANGGTLSRPQLSATLAAAEWESRLSRYLTNALTPPPAGRVAGPRAETAALLRMARLPVSSETIQEGIALINAMGPSRYSQIIAAVFQRWAREAPEAALAAAGGLRDPATKMTLVWKVFEAGAAAEGPAALLEKAAAQPEGVAHTAAFAALTDSLPPNEVEEMLRQSFTGKQHDFQIQLLDKLRQQNPGDPGVPLRFALETGDAAQRAKLIKAALSMTRDWEPGILQKLARNPRNVEGLMYHMSATLRYDAAEGLKMIADWPDANRQKLLLEVFGGAFERLPEGVFRPAMSAENVDILIKETERLEGAEGFRKILAESAMARGARGLDETAAWMLSRQDAAGLDDLTRRAAVAEPFTTARWLAAMPMSAERDRAVAVFSETHAAIDPESATVWAESISDPANRAAALAAVRKSPQKPR